MLLPQPATLQEYTSVACPWHPGELALNSCLQSSENMVAFASTPCVNSSGVTEVGPANQGIHIRCVKLTKVNKGCNDAHTYLSPHKHGKLAQNQPDRARCTHAS